MAKNKQWVDIAGNLLYDEFQNYRMLGHIGIGAASFCVGALYIHELLRNGLFGFFMSQSSWEKIRNSILVDLK
jgi:hypothetical protein